MHMLSRWRSRSQGNRRRGAGSNTLKHAAVFRVRVLTAIILLFALLLVVRLYQVQVAHGDMYRDRAEDQYVHTVEDLYSRGSIYLTTKEGEQVSGATIRSGYVLILDATRLADPESTYAALTKVTPIDRDRFFSSFRRSASTGTSGVTIRGASLPHALSALWGTAAMSIRVSTDSNATTTIF